MIIEFREGVCVRNICIGIYCLLVSCRGHKNIVSRPGYSLTDVYISTRSIIIVFCLLSHPITLLIIN